MFKKKLTFKFKLLILLIVLIISFLLYFFINKIHHNLQTQTAVTISSTVISDTNFLNAVKIKSINEIQNLLDLGARPSAVNANGQNALALVAIFRNQTKIINLLVKYGVNINQADIHGYTPLMYSLIAKASPKVTNQLIASGANVNSENNNGISTLMLALGVDSNDYQLIKLLLDKGADVNYKTTHKITPLMLALRSTRKPEIIQLLIKKGAKINVHDDLGISSYDIFKSNKYLSKNAKLMKIFKKLKH